MNDNQKKEIQRMIDDSLKKAVGFSQRKLGDTPTDKNQLTPQSYVDMSGTIANRPSSVLAKVGQKYFATDLNIPLVFDGNGKWRDGVGSIIASN